MCCELFFCSIMVQIFSPFMWDRVQSLFLYLSFCEFMNILVEWEIFFCWGLLFFAFHLLELLILLIFISMYLTCSSVSISLYRSSFLSIILYHSNQLNRTWYHVLLLTHALPFFSCLDASRPWLTHTLLHSSLLLFFILPSLFLLISSEIFIDSLSSYVLESVSLCFSS